MNYKNKIFTILFIAIGLNIFFVTYIYELKISLMLMIIAIMFYLMRYKKSKLLDII